MSNSFTSISGLIGGEAEFTTHGLNRKATFGVYVSRPYKNASGEYEKDLYSLQAWGRTASYIAELEQLYGSLTGMIALASGHMESYKNSEGQKFWTFKVEKIAISARPSQANGNGPDDLPF